MKFIGCKNQKPRRANKMNNFTDEQVTKIREYLEDNSDVLERLIYDIKDETGEFEDDILIPMEELDEILSERSATEVIEMAINGYDGEWSNSDNQPFNPNRDYFKFNGYGNLVSYDTPDYTDLINDVIDDLDDDVVDLPDEIAELIENDDSEEE